MTVFAGAAPLPHDTSGVSIDTILRIRRIASAAVECFTAADWKLLERTLEGVDEIAKYRYLYADLRFHPDDYPQDVCEVLADLTASNPRNLDVVERLAAELFGMSSAQGPNREGPCLVFISHKSEEKRSATILKEWLGCLGIDGFVAHEDIEVSSEWEQRLEECLRTCDAVVYLASRASNGSDWCQQEVGWGLGRGLPVVPVAIGANPTAILGARQAVVGRDLAVAAEEVTRALMRDPATAVRSIDGLVRALGESRSFDLSNRIASCLRDAPVLTREQAEAIEAAISSNDQVAKASFGALPDQLRGIVAEKLEA